jgi:hypothetical protein
MEFSLFETAALTHIEKYKQVINELPSLRDRQTYMNSASDIPISDFYIEADQLRRDNNIPLNEEYKEKIKSLVNQIVFDLFAYCRETQ